MEPVFAIRCVAGGPPIFDVPRFLDGRTGDGTVGLAPSPDGFSGTRWAFGSSNGVDTLECLGDVAGRFLDGRTGDGTVGLAPSPDGFSGTRWVSYFISSEIFTLECLGDVAGPRFLDGRTGDGTVGLAPSIDGFSGTRWVLVKVGFR